MQTPSSTDNTKNNQRACWCGSGILEPFSDDYSLCPSCGTLVLQKILPSNIEMVSDQHDDLYGKNYYLKHLVEDYGYPTMAQRMRADLPGRCLYWLKTLLKYKAQGATILEIGCGHGGSVALFKAAGYEATGLELSPWLVKYAEKQWDITVLQGPIQQQTISAGSLDAVLMMDVLEHLEKPEVTLSHCVNLLKPDGIFIIQTPQTPEHPSLKQFIEEKSPFLGQLKPSEHIYLYSSFALKRLLKKCGAANVVFEPALFSHYDQYCVASPISPKERTQKQIEASLAKSSQRRVVMALLDLADAREAADQRAERNKNDADQRLAQIEKLTENVKGLGADSLARLKQIEELMTQLSEANIDRQARMDQINELTKQLSEANIDRQARMDQINELTKQLIEANVDRQARMDQILKLTKQLVEANKDRQAKMQQAIAIAEELAKWQVNLQKISGQIEKLEKDITD